MEKTILVVDDCPDISFTIKQRLKDLGAEYNISSVESGEKCLEQLENNKIPDLILLDIMMCGITGWEVFDRLQENQSWKNIPIIFLTARTDKIAKTAGSYLAADYIEKPFEIKDLKKRIDNILNKE